MAIVKSKLLKKLSTSYPNFLKKDLEKFTNIILKEIKQTLKRGERVEKMHTPDKKTIHIKMAKDLFKKINNV